MYCGFTRTLDEKTLQHTFEHLLVTAGRAPVEVDLGVRARSSIANFNIAGEAQPIACAAYYGHLEGFRLKNQILP